MSKTSIIAHPPRVHFIRLREDFILLTQDSPDMHAAALILDRFEYWTNSKLDEFQEDFDKCWIYKSIEEMQTDLYDLFGRNKILNCLQWLYENNYLERRNNPDNNWDKTYQYRLNYGVLNSELSIVWNGNVDSLELNPRKSQTKPAIPKKTTKKTSIENNTEVKPFVFAALKHHELVDKDGKRLDPMILQMEYNALFYAWLEVLEANGMSRGNDYQALWERERDGAVMLAKQRITPDELKRFVSEDLLADKPGGNWYKNNAQIPKLETAAGRIGVWLADSLPITDQDNMTHDEGGNKDNSAAPVRGLSSETRKKIFNEYLNKK